MQLLLLPIDQLAVHLRLAVPQPFSKILITGVITVTITTKAIGDATTTVRNTKAASSDPTTTISTHSPTITVTKTITTLTTLASTGVTAMAHITTKGSLLHKPQCSITSIKRRPYSTLSTVKPLLRHSRIRARKKVAKMGNMLKHRHSKLSMEMDRLSRWLKLRKRSNKQWFPPWVS